MMRVCCVRASALALRRPHATHLCRSGLTRHDRLTFIKSGRRYKSEPANKGKEATKRVVEDTTLSDKSADVSESKQETLVYLRQKSGELFEASKPFVEATWETTKSVSKKTLGASRTMLETTGRFAVDKTKKGVAAAGAGMRRRVQSSVDMILDRVRNAVSGWTWAVRGSVNNVVRSVAAPFEKFSESLSQSGSSVWNRLWWWSLSAIAVYGVATTVPKELIQRSKDKIVDESSS